MSQSSEPRGTVPTSGGGESAEDNDSTYDDAPSSHEEQAFAPGAAEEAPPHSDDVPTLEPDETIPPRPEEEVADADRSDRP